LESPRSKADFNQLSKQVWIYIVTQRRRQMMLIICRSRYLP